MLLKKLFFSSGKDDKYEELNQKLRLLELEIQKLSLLEKKWEKQQEDALSPIVIEKVNIERVVFDKFELNNNFGQLGIKELKGKLNIGATYGSDFIRPEADKEKEERVERKKEEKPAAEGPKINIQSRKANG